MPKMKTHRGAAKRLKPTASGKIKRAKAYHGHMLSKKTSKRKRNLRHAGLLEPADRKRVKKLLPGF